MKWHKKITVEIPVVLCLFSFLLTSSLLTNFIYYRTCYTILGHDEAECQQLGKRTEKGETSQLEKEVQKSANIIVMITELPTTLMTMVTTILAGSWSDRYGRKPVLMLVMGGLTLHFGLFGLFIFFRNLTPWAFLITSIPSVLTGSSLTYFTVNLAYLNDISTPETRGLRMAIYESVIMIGMFSGTFCSSFLFYATSYETCFLLASGLIGLSLLYTIFFIPESLDPKKQESSKKKLHSAFEFRHFRDTFRTTLKKRQNNNRTHLLLIVATLTLTSFISQGERHIKFPFVREKLQWTLSKNNIYYSIQLALHMLVSMVGVYLLHHILKIKAAVLALIGLISMALGSLLLGFTVNDFYVYGGKEYLNLYKKHLLLHI